MISLVSSVTGTSLGNFTESFFIYLINSFSLNSPLMRPAKGKEPYIIAYNIIPIAQTSIAGVVSAMTFSKHSGAMYDRVPASTFSSATPAIPKSTTLTKLSA